MEIVFAIVTFISGGLIGWFLMFLAAYFADEDNGALATICFFLAFASWIGIGILWTGALVVSFIDHL